MSCFYRLLNSVIPTFFLVVGHVGADPLTEHNAILYDYFSSISALPILSPNNEMPGDVYASPGNLYQRQKSCFPELANEETQTKLRSVSVSSNSTFAGKIGVSGRRFLLFGSASFGGEVDLKHEVSLSFGPPVRSFTSFQEDIAGYIKEPAKFNDCIQYILSRLGADVPNSPHLGIPWIVKRVWYATEVVSAQTVRISDADVRTNVKQDLAQLSVSSEVSISENEDSLVISYTSDELPVAWRPTFISLENFDHVREILEKEKWFVFLLENTPFYQSKSDLLQTLREEFKIQLEETIPQPNEIISSMGQLPAIAFEPENEAHVQYLKSLGVLLAISSEVHPPE